MNTPENEKPKALVVGDKNFLGYFLEKFLEKQGCEVLDEAEPRRLGNIDYIFCLPGVAPEKISRLVELAKSTSAKFLLATTGDWPPTLDPRGLDFRIVRLGTVYGPRMAKADWQKLGKGNDFFGPQPVFITDAVYGLIKAMFAPGTKGRTFNLLGKNSQLGWEPQVGFDEGLAKTKEWFAKTKPAPAFPVLPFLLLLIVIVSYPFVSLGVWSLWGARNLQKAYFAALRGDFKKTQNSAQMANQSFSQARGNLDKITVLADLFGQENLINQAHGYLDLGQQLAAGATSLGSAAEKGANLGKFIFQNQPLEAQKTIGEIKIDLDQAHEKLSLGETGAKKQPFYPEITKVRELVFQARNGLSLLPDLIGLSSKRRVYLVLFQNNMELRPTGGFIGSFGLATFHQGRLADFEVQDVYWADGQLRGHVEPPADLKKYLGEAGWYLRDSNWDPDFPTSAQRAAWFLEKETGRTVDGVIGLNLKVAEKILKATGEVAVPDFGERINAQNLFEKAEYYSEVNFFPGSTQKQDFLGALAKNLLTTVKNIDSRILVGLVQSIYRSLQTKDLMVWLNDPKSSQIIAGFGWDGGIRSARCQVPGAKCISDYLMVVEANVGVNKANFFMTRNLSHDVKVSQDGAIEETLKLNYQNASTSETTPGGNYKSYLRLYLPLKSEPLKISIKNPKTGQSELLEKKKWEIKEEHQRLALGFALEVPIQENRQVEVVYRLSDKISDEPGYYLLTLQKQPGITDENFQFSFEPPPGVMIFSAQPAPMTTAKGVAFSPKFDRDLLFEIGLAK